MIIITLTYYPGEIARDVGKRFVELPPLVDYISMGGPYVDSSETEGIRAITIYEFDDAVYPDAIKALNERMAFFLDIPGFKYSLKHWLEVQDALSLVGLE